MVIYLFIITGTDEYTPVLRSLCYDVNASRIKRKPLIWMTWNLTQFPQGHGYRVNISKFLHQLPL